MLIDAHCHLERDTYKEELDEVIARAFDAGLTHLVAVGASGVTAGAHEAVALAERLNRVYATVGLHPHEASKVRDADVEVIEGLLDHPKVVALARSASITIMIFRRAASSAPCSSACWRSPSSATYR